MAEALPQHDHCTECDEPIEVGNRYCSEECRLKHEAMLRKERNKNVIFLIIIVALFAAITAGYLLT